MKEKIFGDIKKARLTDASAISRLVKPFARRGMMLPRDPEKIIEDINDFFVVRNEKGKIVGCAALHQLGPGLGEIKALAVNESNQRSGIGEALVRACLVEAGEKSLSRVFLLTYKTKYFGRLGFEIVDLDLIPEKLHGECEECPRTYPACREIAMIYKPN